MAKIITVWGNPGSGKSVFCCCLAKTLTAGKDKAIIISADSATPMLPVWMPDRLQTETASLQFRYGGNAGFSYLLHPLWRFRLHLGQYRFRKDHHYGLAFIHGSG